MLCSAKFLYLAGSGDLALLFPFLILTILILLQRHLGIAIPLERRENTSGAVASETKQCSEIGVNLLKVGGTAADAVSGDMRPILASQLLRKIPRSSSGRGENGELLVDIYSDGRHGDLCRSDW